MIWVLIASDPDLCILLTFANATLVVLFIIRLTKAYRKNAVTSDGSPVNIAILGNNAFYNLLH